MHGCDIWLFLQVLIDDLDHHNPLNNKPHLRKPPFKPFDTHPLDVITLQPAKAPPLLCSQTHTNYASLVNTVRTIRPIKKGPRLTPHIHNPKHPETLHPAYQTRSSASNYDSAPFGCDPGLGIVEGYIRMKQRVEE